MEAQSSEIKFPAEENAVPKKERSAAEIEEHERLSNQLIKLGDMMGDGLHYEKGGKWISAEYKKISRLLSPEINQAYLNQKKARKDHINEQIRKLLKDFRCTCGGICIQARSGSKVSYCGKCNKRYMATSGKKKK